MGAGFKRIMYTLMIIILGFIFSFLNKLFVIAVQVALILP